LIGAAVAGATASCSEALGLLVEAHPDVVLLDLRLPDATGAEAVLRIREVAPTLPIVAFSVDRTPTIVRSVLRAGASGYVTKDAPISRLVAALRAAAAGLVAMGPEEALAAASAPEPIRTEGAGTNGDDRGSHADPVLGQSGAEPPHEPLTPRELELLRYMAEGYTNKELARAMVLAEDTVKKAVQTLIAKLGAADRTHAVVIALRNRLIE
jgi:DNA-binding NarL/FixJ family response regulator